MSQKPVKDYDKFNLRFPDGMRDAIADRAKANGRSMNSEIVQILQDALLTEEDAKEPITDEFYKIQSDITSISDKADRDKYLSDLEKKDPFMAAIMRETAAHNDRLISILGKHMEKDK